MKLPIVDPEFAELIPKMGDAEREGLKASLLTEGCREPLLVWKEEGLLLDGHNRLAICEEEGVEFHLAEMSMPSRSDAVLWIISNQLGRRNLNNYQRARLVNRKRDFVAAEAAERGRRGFSTKVTEETEIDDPDQKSDQGRTNEILGAEAGLSHDTMHKVHVLEIQADEETKEKLEAGEVSINAAYAKVRRKNAKRGRKSRNKPAPCGRCRCCKEWKRRAE